MLHSYGDPRREYSYEYFNFFLTLQAMGHEVELFDYMGEIRATGKEAMNHKLLEKVKQWQPDVSIFSLYTDQFDPATIESLKQHSKTFCFFHDDTWRVEYSQYWAGKFDFFSSPDLHAATKYRELGLENCIYFPFGCNKDVFKKTATEKKYDVSFVGGWHSYRDWLIRKLRRAGIKVHAFGHGWPAGEVAQDKMVDIFNASRINLNLSNSVSWDLRYLASSPRALVNRLRSKKSIEQMKARIFEVNGCGSFQLSYFVEGLACCYEIDQEIGVYADADDLVEKVRFYLAQEELRESIAAAGYARTLRDHTYERRFQTVFRKMGLVND
ncbi:glycosyltransferase [Leeia sp.]|uniref:CgeB family protein n=1 Tax=Leeia sp. TaxID=2884678 RepID=UPI0035AF11DC